MSASLSGRAAALNRTINFGLRPDHRVAKISLQIAKVFVRGQDERYLALSTMVLALMTKVALSDQ